jgi:hypothetical protein
MSAILTLMSEAWTDHLPMVINEEGFSMPTETRVYDEETARHRRREMNAEDNIREAIDDEAKKNKGFVQVYAKGWRRIQCLLLANKVAAQIYAFLAEHIDSSCGAVVCTQQVLAEQFGVHERTIRRAVEYLESVNAVVVIKIGTANAYCLDPEEVWRSWDTSKNYAAFNTKTLARKIDNNTVKRKLQVMMHQKSEESEAPLDA